MAAHFSVSRAFPLDNFLNKPSFAESNDRMKKALLIATTLFATAISANAAKIAIKNDTKVPQKISVVQGGKIKAYVARLKPKKTLLVKVDDAGPKPMIVLNDDGYVFVPAKNNAFKLTWLRDLIY